MKDLELARKETGFFVSTFRARGLYPFTRKGKFAPATLSFFIFILLITQSCMAETGTASWYSVESCKREGTWQKYGGKMANGEVFDDKKFTCASWDYKFGTTLRVWNVASNESVTVIVTDKGPAKRLYQMGRIIDLSKAAFSAIADLKQGIIQVKVEEVKS